MFVRPSMHRLSIFLTGAAVPLLIIGLGMAPTATGNIAQPEKIQKLLEEQRAVLKEAVQLAVREYRTGRVDFDSVLELRRDLLIAELELAASREERIKLLEEFAELANEFEKFATERFRSGQGTQVDVLRAKAALLKSQIDLERAKLKND